jgi:glycosyltransferase involved in cell wall biosynthesis
MSGAPANDRAGGAATAASAFRLLVVMNGCLADRTHSIGGGDLVLFKFIRHCRTPPDILIPASAQEFVPAAGRRFLTLRNWGLSVPGILAVFLVRTAQGVWRAWRNRQVYDVALASSPFGVEVLPLWCWKARHKGAVIYHVLPKRKAVSLSTWLRFGLAALEQRVTLKLIDRACDFVVAGNAHTRQQLQARMPHKTYFVLPAGFDAAAIDRVPAPPKDPNLACFVGRLVSQKGIFELLKVMAAIARYKPAFRLVLAGTGPEREAFVTGMQRLKLDNIQLAGFVSEAEKIALLKKSAFFFFPSFEEGWGIALAEALYCECRCVCYELPHYRSSFGELPVYARLGEPEDFVRAFQASGPVPADQKSRMRRYDDPQVAAQLLEHLRAVAQRPPAH